MRPSLRSAVELRLGEIRRRLTQDLVRPPQLPILALQTREPLPLAARQPRADAVVALSPPDPLPQRLRRAAHLPRDRLDRRPLRCVVPLMLQDHPDRPLPHLRCELRRSCHGSILSKKWSLRKSRGGSNSPRTDPWSPIHTYCQHLNPPPPL